MHILLVYSLIICIKVFLSFKAQLKSDTLHKFPSLFVVHLLSPVQLFMNLWTVASQASVSFTTSQSLFNLISVVLMMPSNHLILCHPLLFLSSIFPSIGVFSNKSALHIRWQNTGVSASASVLPMNIQIWFPLELTGLISLQSKGLSRFFSSITIQKHLFFSTQPSLWSNYHTHTWLLENNSFDHIKLCQQSDIFSFWYSHIIWLSEVADISPRNLDSSLWFIQPGISHDVLCM